MRIKTFCYILSKNFQSRFWSKIRQTTPNDCWIWTKSINNKGYGQINWGRHTGKLLVGLSHRTAWISFYKVPIPDGACVLHSCDNPKCCNPRHLKLGTQIDNIRDMDQKGRRKNHNLFGEDHGMSKHNDKRVFDIRKKFATGYFLQSELAELFNTSRTTIANIVHRRTWRHI